MSVLFREKVVVFVFAIIYCIASLSVPAHVYAYEESFKNVPSEGEVEFAEHEYLVGFVEDDSAHISNENEMPDSVTVFVGETVANVSVAPVDPDTGIGLVTLPAEINASQAIAALEAREDVVYVEPNYRYTVAALNINDTYANSLWGLEKIDVSTAWSYEGVSASGTIVAVIDTGAAYNHPDLVGNMWDGSQCVNENGVSIQGGCKYGYDFADNDTDPSPKLFLSTYNEGPHGTHVAGTIAATKNNGEGIAGVAPRARIMALKSELYSDEIIRAIAFARENGAKVINASYEGTGWSLSMRNAIQAFPGLVIAASGNSGNDLDVSPSYPCAYGLSNIICVGATDSNDALTSWSNYGSTTVDIVAPGNDIFSTVFSTTSKYSENLSGVTVPNIPVYLATSGVQFNWRTATTSISGEVYTHLYTDTNPYPANTETSITLPAVNLVNNNAQSAAIAFGIRCDTEIATSTWEDYIGLQWSLDGQNYFEASSTYVFLGNSTYKTNNPSELRFDENLLSELGGVADADSYGGYVYVDIPSRALGMSTFTRFVWKTNAVDSTHWGCRLSNISIESTDGATGYGSMNGTSMATPHVAGLAAHLFDVAPSLSAMTAREIILGTGDYISSLAGKTVTSSRINAGRAIASTTESRVLSFAITGGTTTIDHASKTISVLLPQGSSKVATPTISVSSWATISPLSGVSQDFTASTSHTVTAASGATSTYVVSVTVPEAEQNTGGGGSGGGGGGGGFGGGSSGGGSGGGGGGGSSAISVLSATKSEKIETSSVQNFAPVLHLTRDLSLDSRGVEVTILQKILTREGVYTGPITEYFGVLTKSAVQAFQKKYGITPASGYVGPLTRKKMNELDQTPADAQTITLDIDAQAAIDARIAELKAKIELLMRQLAELLKNQAR